MGAMFEELDYWPTEIGALTLRRRWEPRLGRDVYEIHLGGESLMTSAITESEVALADLGLAAAGANRPLDVVVGGLGLGHTAHAALAHDTVQSLIVVEMLEGVLSWHERGLLPLSAQLTEDPRCRLVQGDFFALASAASGFDPDRPGRRFDAILVDIDHSPEMLLDDRSTAFYGPDGLRALAAHLTPGGVFGLWSNDRPDPAFADRLGQAFAHARAEPVTFHNPFQDRPFTQTVYLGQTAAATSSP